MEPLTEFTIEKAAVADFDEITAVWEASVRATHHFLSEDDILFFKPLIRNQYLSAVDLYCTRDQKGRILGFLGTSAEKIEMLFIHPRSRGKGVGKALLRFAVDTLQKKAVDVNEQNEQAVGFYRHFGFTVISRSEIDSMGKPYPLLTMHYLQ
ncbi:MAG TPA: GNAT family N-acetyltransferase [Flavisolibacter sp.]|jgi:putative acetyltransferase|nr:GNAT family N-acetyltransferase [Flavisolibacter sp.]